MREKGQQNDKFPSSVKFIQFKSHLMKIKDTDMACRISTQIAQLFPCSSERVHAYKMAVAFADRWKSSLKSANDEQVNSRDADHA